MILVEFEVEITGHPDKSHWTTQVLLGSEDKEQMVQAAYRWITNLHGTLLGTNIIPVGPITMRSADYAIWNGVEKNLNVRKYRFYGKLPYSEWSQ